MKSSMSDPIFVGTAPAFPLAIVLQAIETNQLTGVLRLGFRGDEDRRGAKLAFLGGKLVAAQDRRQPDDASSCALRILARANVHEVAYSFRDDVRVMPSTNPLSVTGLLLEVARIDDEASR